MFISFVCFVSISKRKLELALWMTVEFKHARSEALTQEAVQAAKSKDTFISTLSHEIRNPLNLIKGSIDYMMLVVENPQHLSMIKDGKLGCEILLNLVNNVLDAAKLRSDKMEISLSETRFAQIVENVLTVNSENIKTKNIDAQAFIDQDLPHTIRTDPSRTHASDDESILERPKVHWQQWQDPFARSLVYIRHCCRSALITDKNNV